MLFDHIRLLGTGVARRSHAVACALVLCAGISTTALGQIRLTGASDANWTVLTMASDGAWGAATEEYVNRAIAKAIARCRAMSTRALGCGAYQISVQRSWALGLRCGDRNILTAGATLAEATESARRREEELRRRYHPGMASFRHIVSVAPDGSIATPAAGPAASGLTAER